MDVYLASGNEHKFEEFLELVHKLRIPVTLKRITDIGGMPDVEESGTTFDENARIKAHALMDKLPAGAWALSDDSGLEVDALDGAPGVYSARYAGPGGNAVANNIKLIQALKGTEMPERTARFACVLCFANPEGEEHLFKGTCEGHIMLAPSGKLGFGYDPLFRPLGYNRTFADLGSAVKSNLSHRARAADAWGQYLKELNA
ncbi:MAG: RdgB/HAM1 family non-canonical purine NTP pyrophosphatase [Puniceicoccaceae bacterium]